MNCHSPTQLYMLFPKFKLPALRQCKCE